MLATVLASHGVQSVLVYSSEKSAMKVNNTRRMKKVENTIMKWMCGVTNGCVVWSEFLGCGGRKRVYFFHYKHWGGHITKIRNSQKFGGIMSQMSLRKYWSFYFA